MRLRATKHNNTDTGGRIVIQNGYEWLMQAKGYLGSLKDIDDVTVTLRNGVPVTIKETGGLELVPGHRSGMADPNGLGAGVVGIVVARNRKRGGEGRRGEAGWGRRMEKRR